MSAEDTSKPSEKPQPEGGSVYALRGLFFDPHRPRLSIEEMKRGMLDGLAADDARIRGYSIKS